MAPSASATAVERGSAGLAARLESRRGEIEEAVLTRVFSVADAEEARDPKYRQGLRAAVGVAIDYGIASVRVGEERSLPPPPTLRTQARIAAGAGVNLDTVLRRYFAGHALLGDFVVQEAERCGMPRAELQRLLRSQAALFDRLIAAVSDEHGRELERRPGTLEERRIERIERLLAGELIDASSLGYALEGHHTGIVLAGSGAERAVREAAAALDRHLLAVRCAEGSLWAWLGGRRPLDPDRLAEALSSPDAVAAAVGEPGEGVTGWRLTHRQAKAALPVALRRSGSLVRYAEVALLASILQDEVLIASLRALYLVPLDDAREGRETLCETLRAYFEANRNVSSAAALGVSRQAVTRRLLLVEKHLGRSLTTCALEVELALQLESVECLVDLS